MQIDPTKSHFEQNLQAIAIAHAEIVAKISADEPYHPDSFDQGRLFAIRLALDDLRDFIIDQD